MADFENVLLLGNFRPTVAIARRLAGLGDRVIMTPGRSRSGALALLPPDSRTMDGKVCR